MQILNYDNDKNKIFKLDIPKINKPKQNNCYIHFINWIFV